MVQNIKEGIKKNHSLLFFALSVAILFGGMFVTSRTPGVEAARPGVTSLSCSADGSYSTQSGGYCTSDTQCASGLTCVGATGSSCIQGVAGTCQEVNYVDSDDVNSPG